MSEYVLTVQPKMMSVQTPRLFTASFSSDRIKLSKSKTPTDMNQTKIKGKLHFGVRLRADAMAPKTDRDLLKIKSLLQLPPKPMYKTSDNTLDECDIATISITSSTGGALERRLMMIGDDMTPMDFRAPGPSQSAPQTAPERGKHSSRISRGIVSRPYSAMNDELKEDEYNPFSASSPSSLILTSMEKSRRWSLSGQTSGVSGDDSWGFSTTLPGAEVGGETVD